MATKTYLQLVNSVLIRLRETTVATVSETTYSALIGEWVNDAKRMVEDAWPWQALENTANVSILASTTTYTISTLNERSQLIFDPVTNIPLAWDTTSGDKFQLVYWPYQKVVAERIVLNTPNSQDKPIIFGVHKTPTSGVLVELYETPTSSRTWTLYFKDPQDDFSLDADILLVPYAPVIQIALDYALNERGEEIGEPGTTVQQKAMIHISNAIALDSLEQNGHSTWVPN